MRDVTQSIIIAALILTMALAMRLAEAQGWLQDADDRAFGVIIGILLAGMGDLLPKRVTDAASCEFDRSFRMRRFAGIAFVLAGLAHAGIWIFAPLEMANLLAMSVVALALGLVLIRAFVRPTA